MLDPDLTYRGAVRRLGDESEPAIEALHRALAFNVVSRDPVPGTAMGALWQSDDGVRGRTAAVTDLLTHIKGRVVQASGVRRLHMIVGAHALVVVEAFFRAVEEVTGEVYRSLKIPESARTDLIKHSYTDPRAPLLQNLYETEIPLPSPHPPRGEIAQRPIQQYFERVTSLTMQAARNTEAWAAVGRRLEEPRTEQNLVTRALGIYEDMYLQLAGDVHEFAIWVARGGRSTVPSRPVTHDRKLLKAFDQKSDCLAKLERLLDFCGPGHTPGWHGPQMMLRRANLGVLSRPLLQHDEIPYLRGIRVPAIERGYITPGFRVAVYRSDSDPSSDDWWSATPVRFDLDNFLAAHLTSPRAVRIPLLVLGLPGAGKSLFSEVMAARVSPEGFAAVRVSLRMVNASSRIHEQVAEALAAQTQAGAEWNDLTPPDHPTVRVVLFDGLDELLQAPGAEFRDGYLQEVTRFQEMALAMDCPVAAVVTSRTVVADRTAIPDGCLMVRLEHFDDAQIHQWLATWHDVNAEGLRGHLRPLETRSALVHRELARQPLLLIMLALYSADPANPPLDEASLSIADLYSRLMVNFLRRETSKREPIKQLGAGDEDEETEERLWRLKVAALAMFNRGVQRVDEKTLQNDIRALLADDDARALSTDGDKLDRAAEQTIAGFFFIHTSQSVSAGHAARSFEFLHATFQEYLVAAAVVDELASLSRFFGAGRGRRSEVNDDLLYAILSHQVLSTSSPVLSFLTQLLEACSSDVRRVAPRLVAALLSTARRRQGTGRYAGYWPAGEDIVRATAAYTANLVILDVLLRGDGIDPCPADRRTKAERQAWWTSTQHLLLAGLGESSTRSWNLFLGRTEAQLGQHANNGTGTGSEG